MSVALASEPLKPIFTKSIPNIYYGSTLRAGGIILKINPYFFKLPPQNFYFIFSFTKTLNMEFFLFHVKISPCGPITKHNPQKCVLHMFHIKIPFLANFKLLCSNNWPYSDEICNTKHVFRFKINSREMISKIVENKPLFLPKKSNHQFSTF